MIDRIKIHPSFLLMWIFFLLCDKTFSVLYLFLAAALHESAHIAAYMTFGADMERIDILPFGISAKLRRADTLDCKREILCAGAGIAANLAFAAVLSVMLTLPATKGTALLILCNLALATINILPLYPLDGGRILYFILLKRLSPHTARRVTFAASYILLIPLFLLSVWLITRGEYNFSLLLITFYIFFYLLIKKTV